MTLTELVRGADSTRALEPSRGPEDRPAGRSPGLAPEDLETAIDGYRRWFDRQRAPLVDPVGPGPGDDERSGGLS